MFKKSTLQFLKDIKTHNTREWFVEKKDKYEAAKEDFEQLITKVIAGICKFDEHTKDLETKNCTYRQYRDVRFSKDKRPYKINMGAYINRGGKKSHFAGYYFHLEPGDNSFIGGGLWVPEKEQLNKVRQEVYYCFDEFESILANKKFKKVYGGLSSSEGMKLKTVPKGYAINDPAIEYLKYKSFVALKKVTDRELMESSLLKNTIEAYRTLKPMLDFINRSIE